MRLDVHPVRAAGRGVVQNLDREILARQDGFVHDGYRCLVGLGSLQDVDPGSGRAPIERIPGGADEGVVDPFDRTVDIGDDDKVVGGVHDQSVGPQFGVQRDQFGGSLLPLAARTPRGVSGHAEEDQESAGGDARNNISLSVCPSSWRVSSLALPARTFRLISPSLTSWL